MAQNLVPNGDFEGFSDCPSAISQVYLATPWSNPTTASPDYFNSCAPEGNSVSVPQNAFGAQHPKSGNAYSGVYVFNKTQINLRDYIQVELTDSLIKDSQYQVSFWASLADNFMYSISTVGAYFSEGVISLNDNDNFEFQPQVINEPLGPLTDKENWVLIRDTFVSLGGEKFITIGNFSDDANSDTMYVGNGENNSLSSYYYIDDVSVVPLDSIVGVEEKKEIELSLYPNPAQNQLTIETNFPKKASLQLMDITGRFVLRQKLNSGKTGVDISYLPAGVYTAVLWQAGAVMAREKLIVR